MHNFTETIKNTTIKALTKFYSKVVYKSFDDIDSASLMDDFVKKTFQSNSFDKKALILKREEPTFLLEHSVVPIQYLNLIRVFKSNAVWNVDFYIVSGWDSTMHCIKKYLNSNSYGYTFYDIDTKTFIFEKEGHNSLPDSELNADEIIHNMCSLNICWNKSHRILWSKFLLQNNFFENNIISIRPAKPRDNRIVKKINDKNDNTVDEKYISHPMVNDDGFYIKQRLTALNNNEELIFKQHELVNEDLESVLLDFRQHAGIIFANETCFHNHHPRVSEKVAQAIVNKRPFVIIGPPGSLQYVKNLGYHTFDDLIDPSYDNISNDNDRMEALMDLALQIKDWPISKITNYVRNNQDKLTHNYHQLLNAKNNLENTLKNAILQICQ